LKIEDIDYFQRFAFFRVHASESSTYTATQADEMEIIQRRKDEKKNLDEIGSDNNFDRQNRIYSALQQCLSRAGISNRLRKSADKQPVQVPRRKIPPREGNDKDQIYFIVVISVRAKHEGRRKIADHVHIQIGKESTRFFYYVEREKKCTNCLT
jgi:hypothetical protein